MYLSLHYTDTEHFHEWLMCQLSCVLLRYCHSCTYCNIVNLSKDNSYNIQNMHRKSTLWDTRISVYFVITYLCEATYF